MQNKSIKEMCNIAGVGRSRWEDGAYAFGSAKSAAENAMKPFWKAAYGPGEKGSRCKACAISSLYGRSSVLTMSLEGNP